MCFESRESPLSHAKVAAGLGPPSGSGEMGRPGGRPRKSPLNRRSCDVRVRLTPLEFDRLAARAASLGEPPAVFARRMALDRSLPRPVPQVNRQAWAELARLAANLNQWVRAINSGTAPTSERPRLEALASELASVRAALLGRE